MKATINEILWEDGKQYKDSHGNVWEVDGRDLYSEDAECITECYNLKAILEMEFEEFIDWDKVEVDTPIWVKFRDGIYRPRHFASYGRGRVYFWVSGNTNHTTKNYEWVYTEDASLTKPKEV